MFIYFVVVYFDFFLRPAVPFKMSPAIGTVFPTWATRKYTNDIEYEQSERFNQQLYNTNNLERNGLLIITGKPNEYIINNQQFTNRHYFTGHYDGNDGTVFKFARPPNINGWAN